MRHLITLLSALACSLAASAQEERFLPVRMLVEVDGEAASGFAVTIYDGNQEVAFLPPSEHSACELKLPLNSLHTIRVSKKGLRDKLITVDTSLPEGVERYKAYPCVVVMMPEDDADQAGLFADFPSAMVRWNPEARRFDHSERYLEDIRNRNGANERMARN